VILQRGWECCDTAAWLGMLLYYSVDRLGCMGMGLLFLLGHVAHGGFVTQDVSSGITPG